MTISRRDTILISVLMNVGLLVFLLIIAIHNDDPESVQKEPAIANKPVVKESEEMALASNRQPAPAKPVVEEEPESDLPTDEVDRVLQAYTVQSSKNAQREHIQRHEPEKPVLQPLNEKREGYKQIVVSEGDVLGRIAHYNQTTVSEIKRINKLQGDRLRIGQVLLVPERKETSATPKMENRIGASDKEAVYYEVKSGDNPWKIAHKFNINYDDILRLNNLDEQKARNLRVGDKIRIQ